MCEDDIEPRLREEIQRAEAGKRPDEAIAVIIKKAGDISEVVDGDTDMQALDKRVWAAQQGLRDRLAELGVTDVRQITLSNALEVALAPAQIREMARHPEVEQILFDREDRVAI